jgi:hypothetical protein
VPGTHNRGKRLTSQARTSTGTFTDRQIRQRRRVRDQLLRADRTVCHFAGSGGDRGIGMHTIRLGSVADIWSALSDTPRTRIEFNPGIK